MTVLQEDRRVLHACEVAGEDDGVAAWAKVGMVGEAAVGVKQLLQPTAIGPDLHTPTRSRLQAKFTVRQLDKVKTFPQLGGTVHWGFAAV